MGELFAIAVVCGVLGYVWGRVQATGDKELDIKPVEPEPTFDGIDPNVLKCFKRLVVDRYIRGHVEITFELNMDELQPDERKVISNTVSISPDGSASLELVYNTDYDY